MADGRWQMVDDTWCDHKASVTIYVREREWMEVGAWVYENFDSLSGVSFLPHSDHIYRQTPYEEITKAEYQALKKAMPKSIDWTEELSERTDQTTASQELACTAGGCDL